MWHRSCALLWNVSVQRFFNEFLMTHERHIAKEIRDEYVETMSKIYYSYFKGYLSRLTKLQVLSRMLCAADEIQMSPVT